MKTLFTLAMAGALSFNALAANSNEDLKDLLTVNSKFKKINVTLKEGVEEAKIVLLDEDGKKLHQRKVHVKGDDLMIPYDLDDMPSGKYQLKITTKEEEVIYSVETKDRPIAFSELPLMVFGELIEDNTIKLSVIGLMEPGVEVKVKTEKGGRIIHEEYIDQPEGFKKEFSFKGINPEDVYLEITDAIGRTRIIHF